MSCQEDKKAQHYEYFNINYHMNTPSYLEKLQMTCTSTMEETTLIDSEQCFRKSSICNKFQYSNATHEDMIINIYFCEALATALDLCMT